MLVKQTTKDKL